MLLYLMLLFLAVLFSRQMTKSKIEDLEVERVMLKSPDDIERNEREIRKREFVLKSTKALLVLIVIAITVLIIFIIYHF